MSGGCQPQFADEEDFSQPQFADKENFSQTKFADKEGFPCVSTLTSTNAVLQIWDRQAKCLGGGYGTPHPLWLRPWLQCINFSIAIRP